MNWQENISLKSFNTFGIEARARYFTSFSSVAQLIRLLDNMPNKSSDMLVLGGGSNMLLTKDFDGAVLRNEILGIDIKQESDTHVEVQVGAGVNWHSFVMHCIRQGWGGLENLSLIPGNVGASPMQNIGAYGVEVKDTFLNLQALHIADKTIHTFNARECEFGYRESVFKNIYKGQFIITAVSFKLNKIPKFNTSYGVIEQELERMQVKELSLGAISQAVINIRQSKLPDPKEIGNSGSFFKNPVVSHAIFSNLKRLYPEIPNYPTNDLRVKLAAGWLIDKAGWKGKTIGNYGVHKKQALVLVNYGGASGQDIYNLSEDILNDIESKFGIRLEREVNIL